MRTHQVNKFTYLANKYRKNGKVANNGGEVKNSVLSFYRRKSEFPQTRVGKNMHNFTIMKYKDEYEGMLYVENYPHN